MADSPQNNANPETDDSASHNVTDLPDSLQDEKAMEEEEIIFDLPEVKDIPGQENIVPPKMGMFTDTTISSDGEEGKEIFDEDDDENV